MCTQITKRALHKRARRDVSALASDKSRLYIPFLPLGIAATGTTGTTGTAGTNGATGSPEQPDRIFGSTGTINRTGTGRADLIKFFTMPCPASSVTIHKTTTAQNKGSKQRLKAKAHKQTNNGRRKYHKKDHSL